VSATDKLTGLLKAAGAVPTWDPERNVTKPCFGCGTTNSPRELVDVGTWSRQVGNHCLVGEPIRRPMCSECALMTTPKPAVKTWRYHLPSIRGEGWAIAFLDSIGCFTCLSDFDDWSYRWPEAGWGPRDFRQFILRCNDHYILHKVARDDTYYGAQTLRNVKERILERRRHGGWDRSKARREWDLLREHDDLDSRESFAMWWQQTEIDDCSELAHWDVPPRATAFFKHVMPRLREVIRAELTAEGLAI
jgi:hypothetical protein